MVEPGREGICEYKFSKWAAGQGDNLVTGACITGQEQGVVFVKLCNKVPVPSLLNITRKICSISSIRGIGTLYRPLRGMFLVEFLVRKIAFRHHIYPNAEVCTNRVLTPVPRALTAPRPLLQLPRKPRLHHSRSGQGLFQVEHHPKFP